MSFTAWYWQCRVVVSADRGDLQTRRHERRVSLLGQRHSILGHPSGFLFAAFVSSQPHVARFPASECGTCFGLPDSPRLWPLAPSAPQGVTACCSQVSQLLWPHLTSLNFTSLASSYLCFPLRPRTTARRLRDLPGPDEVLLNVPWFLDPGMPSISPHQERLSGCCLRSSPIGSAHPMTVNLRSSIARPIHSATDASPVISRWQAHGSR